MRKTLTTPALILALLTALPAGPALAEENCFVPMSDWQPRDAVAALAKEKGWTVKRIKIDDGCYEVDARDADGLRIEATIHPASLEIIHLEQEHKGPDED